MADVLNMRCAILAKITNQSYVGALVPIVIVGVLINTCFATLEKVIWGECFVHVGDIALSLGMLAFYLYHLAFLAKLKGEGV